MKRLFALIAALFLVSGLSFAQGKTETDSPEFYSDDMTFREREPERAEKQESFFLEIHAGFPIHWSNNPFDTNPLNKTVTANTSLGFSLVYNFSHKFGIVLASDFAFGSLLIGASQSNSDQSSHFNANAFIGVTFSLHSSDFFKVPLGVGVHMYYFNEELWLSNLGVGNSASINRADIQVGPEIFVALQMHFSDRAYFFSRINIAIDIFRFYETKEINAAALYPAKKDEFFPTINWGIKPALGIGIRF